MKKLLVIVFLVIFFISNARSSFAHSGGASTVKINYKHTSVYISDEYATIDGETIPADIAPDKYLVNKSISFEVDKSKLPVSEEVLKQTTYSWDFGDGKKAKGDKVSHIYAKTKSYVVNLEINYGNQEDSGNVYPDGMGAEPQPQQQFQTILIHILPSLDYKIPLEKLVIDGKTINDPTKDRPRLSFYHDFKFFKYPKNILYDSSRSSGSGKIVSYLWDFGDGEVSKKAKVRHRFKEKLYFYAVGLKLTDENGFSSYVVVNLADKKAFESD
ncbi:MAG TPA: PKD domain-containing protein [Candidatus Limnocylindrales bacterium]|nr:PKD domain-containing protein [Candidatus Limnocylindrales bacterium]